MSAFPDRKTFERALAEWLMRAAKLDAAAFERARRLQEGSGERLEAILTKLGLVSETDLAEALAQALRLPLAGPADFPDEPLLDGRVAPRFLKENRVLPLADAADGLKLAMADPLDDFAARSVELLAGKPVRRLVARPADLDAALDRLYGKPASAIGEIVQDIALDDEQSAEDISRLKDLASEAPVVRLVNHLITRAVEARASDIHIEPYESAIALRYRIDGVLHDVESPPAQLKAAITSRVKIMAKLNIAERRLPQDGRIRLAVRGHEIDLRVSTVPTLHGESVVMRILDRGALSLDFAALGLGGDLLGRYLEVLKNPHGILLVTGPTGSGKTTTLYATLSHLYSPEKKIITVEDPVEYQLERVNQIPVKPQIGLDFAGILRSILRQDPDIIMVGEIRDLETAEIAVQAALTGHLVLSTLHTNDAASSVTRLLDMGVEDYLLPSTLNGVVAQRLVRTLCPHCREPYRPLPELVARLGEAARDATLYRARGCPACQGRGYLGRTVIAELLPMTDEVRRLVLQRADSHALARAARAGGMRTMYEDGIAKALAGATSLEEVVRVTRDA
jgi:general secretion pathway protein E